MKNYELFVVFHQHLEEQYYNKTLLNNYTFVNVNPKNTNVSNYPDYKIINQFEFQTFYPLGKWYTESEVIYNIYKNKYLYSKTEYIGFLQYDIDSTPLNKEELDTLTTHFDLINLQPYLFETDFAQRILMDPQKPNERTGKGLSCYDVIIADYNQFYNTNYTTKDLEGKTINLCSSFILKTAVFVEMMEFVAPVIESGKLNLFDTAHKFRMQGGYLERYYAVWLAFRDLQTTTLKLNHFFQESTVQDSLLNRILRKIGIR